MVLDPALFRPESIDPETAQFIEDLEKMMAGVQPIYKQTPAEVRAARENGRGWRGPIVYSPNAKNRTIKGPKGEITLRTFLPTKIDGAFLHFHGGGWVLGTADSQDERLESLANDCSVAVLSVEYRLAPENPYPAGPDDCEAAALWLVKNVQSEYGTQRLVIGGESAGANLAVAALLRLRDKHSLTGAFAAANLPYGVFDAAGTPSSAGWGTRNLILDTPTMVWFADHYAPRDKQRDPDVSPLYANLRDMPPALFSVGTMDPLLDDSMFMHARWLAAGNEGELVVYPGAVHGFDGFPTERGKRATQRQKAFVREAVSATA